MQRSLAPILVFAILIGLQDPSRAAGTVTACGTDVQQNSGLNLAQAVATGGSVKFDCDGAAVIHITQIHNLTLPTEIDGGNTVTLDARGATAIFSAQVSASPIVLRNIKVLGPTGNPDGGVFSGPAAVLELYNVSVEDAGQTGQAPASGYVIRANSIKAAYSRFRRNSGVVLYAPLLDIRHSEFTDNAGAPFMPHFIDLGGVAFVDDTTFTNNGTAVWRGTIEINRSTFAANGRGSRYGGALSLRGIANLAKTNFFNNTAENGGAIWFSEGELTIRRGKFEGNSASELGGAIAFADGTGRTTLTVTYSHFRANRARSGGAIMLQWGSGLDRSLRGNAVNFSGNSASESGGAILAIRGSIDLARVFFIDNRAVQAGGAILGGATTLDRTRLANALLVRNVATRGSAYAGGMLELVNATVADNQGVAIAQNTPHPVPPDFGYFGPGVLALKNTILFNNSGGNCAPLPPNTVIEDRGHNVQFPSDTCSSSISVLNPGLDSFYVPIPGGSVHHAGDNQTCVAPPVSARDVFGERRPQGGRCTIGAVEGTIERHAIRALRRTDEPGVLRELLKLLDR